jgi:hypothetical protein
MILSGISFSLLGSSFRRSIADGLTNSDLLRADMIVTPARSILINQSPYAKQTPQSVIARSLPEADDVAISHMRVLSHNVRLPRSISSRLHRDFIDARNDRYFKFVFMFYISQ